ncbi:IS1181 transposase [Streptococcus pneumoniae]|nr:IS1181 transposase [Streptococcus pneumoniae]
MNDRYLVMTRLRSSMNDRYLVMTRLQKRKDKICPFSSLAFFQPTTVDKEPEKSPD